MSNLELAGNSRTGDPYKTQDISHWNNLFGSQFDPRTLIQEIQKLGMTDAKKENFWFQKDCKYDDWGTRIFISDGLAERIKKSMSKLEST